MKYKTSHVFEYGLLVAAGRLIRVLPLRIALALGWIVAAATHYVFRIHVERTRKRVRDVLGPDTPEKKIRQVAWISWRNLCFNAIEGFRFGKLTPEKIRKHPIVKAAETLLKVAENSDRGFILATPHMGNWEIAAIAGDLLGLPLFTIARRQKNPLIDAYINKMRCSFNLEVLYRDSKAWKGVVDRLNQGKVLAVLPDINYRKRGVTVDFLNGKTTIATGAATFAWLGNCPVYPVVARRIGWTRHDAVLLNPVFPDLSRDRDEELQRIMQTIMSAISDEVLKTPEQYFWHNKRWVLNP